AILWLEVRRKASGKATRSLGGQSCVRRLECAPRMWLGSAVRRGEPKRGNVSMVTNGSPIDREWLAAIFAEDDKQRAENARFAEELRQKAERTAYAQKSDPESGLIYRDQDEALVTAVVPANAPSSASEGFSEHQRDVIAHLINALRAEWRQDVE